MGSSSQKWLERPKVARVLHVFEEVCNLIDEDGAVVAIQAQGMPMTSLAAKLDVPAGNMGKHGFKSGISPQSKVRTAPGQLSLGPLEISTTPARLWSGRLQSAHLTVVMKRPAGLVERIEYWLRSESPDESLYWAFSSGSGSRRPPSRPQGEATGGIARLAQDRIAIAAGEIISGIRAGDLAQAAAGAEAAAGLGGGLTPAGDDFLLGTFHALWFFWPPDQASRWAGRMAAVALPQTSPLSAAWLQTGAGGEAGEYWQKMFDAWSSGQSEALDESIRKIITTGHTSGSDALTGFSAAAILIGDGISIG